MAKKPKTQPNAELPAFVPRLGNDNAVNVAAAEARGWTYDPDARVYRDATGEPVANRLGGHLVEPEPEPGPKADQ